MDLIANIFSYIVNVIFPFLIALVLGAIAGYCVKQLVSIIIDLDLRNALISVIFVGAILAAVWWISKMLGFSFAVWCGLVIGGIGINLMFIFLEWRDSR